MAIVVKKNLRKKEKHFCEDLLRCDLMYKSFLTIPKLNCGIAITLFILNIFLPGIGTILLSFSKGNNHFKAGVIQILLVIILIGWILSIIWGLEIIKKANSDDAAEEAAEDLDA